jgi:hypothetical protein
MGVISSDVLPSARGRLSLKMTLTPSLSLFERRPCATGGLQR